MSLPLATFDERPDTLEARLGLQSHDAHELALPCGLAITLRRCSVTADLARYELAANRPELEHAMFHLGVTAVSPLVARAEPSVVVTRLDDNGNTFEVARVTSRCEAEALVRRYEARGHKQTYAIQA